MPPAPVPFTFSVPRADVDDLNARLAATRWPDAAPTPPGMRWDSGAPLDYVQVGDRGGRADGRGVGGGAPVSLPLARPAQSLAKKWAAFDWPAFEARVNAHPNFTLAVQPPGKTKPLALHFIHAKSPNPDAIPLLLIHGWPGSFMEFLDLIPDLAGGTPAFELVVPSLPGFGLSAAPAEPGWGLHATADALVELMTALGHGDRFCVQGGDWGAMVAKSIATRHPARVAAVHTNMPVARPAVTRPWTLVQAALAPLAERGVKNPFISKEEALGLKAILRYAAVESGYMRQQSTRPQTLAYGLTDSPAGTLAWVCEKFHAWADRGAVPPGEEAPTAIFGDETLLANVSLYWLNKRIASSIRFYKEVERAGEIKALLASKCAAPTGVLVCPRELFRPPRAWVAAGYNLKRWTRAAAGGHFAALENRAAFVDDVRSFFAEWH